MIKGDKFNVSPILNLKGEFAMGFGDFLKGAVNVASKSYSSYEKKASDTMWGRYSVSELRDIANGYKEGNRAAARKALEDHGYDW